MFAAELVAVPMVDGPILCAIAVFGGAPDAARRRLLFVLATAQLGSRPENRTAAEPKRSAP
jgi:hypothetical protein